MSTQRLLLLAGDALVLLAFAVTGRRTHDEAVGLAAALAVVTTAAPFLAGWLLASGVPRLRTVVPRDARALVVEAAQMWAIAFPVAVLVRAAILGRFSPLSFYLVAFSAALAMLVVWRLVFALLTSQRRATA
ncbi:MAG: DUF3054 domain-containing protein [Dehalococcoidia bacterium]|nr:DUF3054 domain-containing protein [Dehalococcoidia bacterium]